MSAPENNTIATSEDPINAQFMTKEMFKAIRPHESVDVSRLPMPVDFEPLNGFTKDMNEALKSYADGVRPKQFRSMLKKKAKKAPKGKIIAEKLTITFE